MHEIFLQACAKPSSASATISTADEQEGLGVYQVTQKNGERWSAARAYHPPGDGQARQSARRDRTRTPPRILFEGKRAIGVEYRQGEDGSRFAPGAR